MVAISFRMAKTRQWGCGTYEKCTLVPNLTNSLINFMGHGSIIGKPRRTRRLMILFSRSHENRYGHYPKPKYLAHPRDCSVMTYRGHQVLRTLIRCQFSPIETTGGQYLFSGSTDGKIHVSLLSSVMFIVELMRIRSGPLTAVSFKYSTDQDLYQCSLIHQALN